MKKEEIIPLTLSIPKPEIGDIFKIQDKQRMPSTHVAQISSIETSGIGTHWKAYITFRGAQATWVTDGRMLHKPTNWVPESWVLDEAAGCMRPPHLEYIEYTEEKTGVLVRGFVERKATRSRKAGSESDESADGVEDEAPARRTPRRKTAAA